MQKHYTKQFKHGGVSLIATFTDDEDGIWIVDIYAVKNYESNVPIDILITPLVSSLVVESAQRAAEETSREMRESQKPDRHYD